MTTTYRLAKHSDSSIYFIEKRTTSLWDFFTSAGFSYFGSPYVCTAGYSGSLDYAFSTKEEAVEYINKLVSGEIKEPKPKRKEPVSVSIFTDKNWKKK